MLGELVQTTAGEWIIHPPTRCPNGHTLVPNHVLVGHVACLVQHDPIRQMRGGQRECDRLEVGAEDPDQQQDAD